MGVVGIYSTAFVKDTVKSIGDAKLALVGYLNYKIPDPYANRRQGFDLWILASYPDIDVHRPIISISDSSTPFEDRYIGHGVTLIRSRFDIDVFTDRYTKVTVDGRDYKGMHAVDILTDKVVDAIVNGKSYFRDNYGCIDIVVIESSTYEYDSSMDSFRRRVIVQIDIEVSPV